MSSLTPEDADIPLEGVNVIYTEEEMRAGITYHVVHAHVVSFSDEALAVLAAKIKEVLT